METFPGSPSSETKTPNPDSMPEAISPIYSEIANLPFYKRAVGRLLHPVVTIRDLIDLDIINAADLRVKEASWEAAQGGAGKDIAKNLMNGKDNVDLALLPQTAREDRRAARMAGRYKRAAAENEEYFYLQRGPYDIDPVTGKSRWRDTKHNLPDGINRKTRKLIEQNEAAFKHVSHAIIDRDSALLGSERDADGHVRPTKTQLELTADDINVKLEKDRSKANVELLDSLSPDMRAVVKDDEIKALLYKDFAIRSGVARRALIAAGNDRYRQLDTARVQQQQDTEHNLLQRRESAKKRIAEREASLRTRRQRRAQEGRLPRRVARVVRQRIDKKRASFARQQEINRRGVV